MNRMAAEMRETPEEKRARYLAEADALGDRAPSLSRLLRELAEMDGPKGYGDGGGGSGAPPAPQAGGFEP